MIYQILSILTSLFAIVMTAVMLFSFRKPRRITALSSLSSAFISLIMPVIFLAITGAKPDFRLALPFFSFGLLLGFTRGLTMKLEFVGDQVVGKHSILFLLMWGLSLALNQALSTFDSTILLAVGLGAMLISTGTQVGFYGILAVRRLALVPPEVDSGKFGNKAFQRIVTVAFGGLLLIFLIESLLISIPTLSFLTGVLASPQVSSENNLSPAPVLEDEPVYEESPSILEPYFNSDQILIWTRPLAAFSSESEHVLYAFNADGSGVTKVYDQPVSAIDIPAPQFSPDGNLWVVTSIRTGENEHYLMDVDGSQTYQLLYQDALVKIMDWSPDASQMLVQAQPSGSWDVLITDREGVNWQVVANQAADEINPRWSPDGESILYLSNEFGNQDIYLINLKGGTPYNLTRDPAEDKRASWALNGTRIIFTSDRDGFFGLYHMNPDGGDVRLIAQDQNCGFMYLLSPDGEHILYTTDRYYEGDISWGVGQEECESTNRTLLSLAGGETQTHKMNQLRPIWSPDSRKILYSGPYKEGDDPNDLIVYHLDGSGLSNLSSPSTNTFFFTWSSDSTKVAQVESGLIGSPPGSYFLTVTNADGTGRHELAKHPWDLGIAYAFDGFSWP